MRLPLEARVARYARRHDLLPAGAPVLAMVSGGADSLCLMHLLMELHEGTVGVLAVDHGLRPEAADECERVVEAARGLGLPAWVRRPAVGGGAGVQARARAARLAAALELAASEGFARIATGHTATEQAETVLFRIARGTGRTGALGMAPRSGPVVRPLLTVTRDETAAWCAGRGLAPMRDPSNEDPAYARARVRHGLLPALRAVHPGAEAAVARFADLLRDEAELLEGLEAEAWRRAARPGPGPAAPAALDTAALLAEPAPMRRLLVRRLLAAAGLPGEAAESRWVDAALDLAAEGGVREVPGGRLSSAGGLLVAERASREEVPGAGRAARR
ncbi:MAG TPA: tRNA lysidine(34) synthetase TilS [Miltoncostaeaceae bacterium]|nr:tRNA lysidine(34) synthetase TilS [Miltoncostaeaceae bacterium]